MASLNLPTMPYIILNKPIQTFQITESTDNVNGNKLGPPLKVSTTTKKTPKQNTNEEYPCLFQVVYPQDLNLYPPQTPLKRGRPKNKKKIASENVSDVKTETVVLKTPAKKTKTSRTRSGRVVKLPKHMGKDFKQIDIVSNDKEAFTVTDFPKTAENNQSNVEYKGLESKKRLISSQYVCPKCAKTYLGKSRMIEHLKKNPEHGPLPEGFEEYNFDVWNYLYEITQKTKPGQRGRKFCEELSNLLHNVQLLKSALFKKATDNKNCVQIDKVLANAIGLAPGNYRFDENELYKDVTVLKLITNSEFFKPKNSDIDSAVHGKVKEANNFDVEKPNKKLPDDIYADAGNHVVQKPMHRGDFGKKMDDDAILQSDLLTDNLLLHSLPNVDNATNLLDNSTSSDEVMNVDQFVNERFKKITESDIELSNNSLNLDLPSLELFQFHTT